MRRLPCRLGRCLRCRGWKGFGVYFPDIPTCVSRVSGESRCGSVFLPRVPRCPRGQDRMRVRSWRSRPGSGC